MKLKLIFLMTTVAAAIQSLAQQPIIKKDVIQPFPVDTKNMNLNFVLNDSGRKLCQYSPSSKVKYTFFDEKSFAPITGRTLPATGEYITLFTMIDGKEYTIVPERNLNIEDSKNSTNNLVLVETSTVRAAGVPTGPAIWRVTTSGTNVYLNYNGAFAELNAEWEVTGGYMGSQAGKIKVAGNAAALSSLWQLQTVNANGNTYVQVKNAADNTLLGYTYTRGQAVRINGETRNLSSPPTLVPLVGTSCPGGANCETKWFYKIYRYQKGIGTPKFKANLPGGAYLVNIVYDNKTMKWNTSGFSFDRTDQHNIDMQWVFEPTSRGTYFIFSKRTNQALGVRATDKQFVFQPIDNNNFLETDGFQWSVGGPIEGKYVITPVLNYLSPNNTISLTCKNSSTVTLERMVSGSYWQEFMIDSLNGPLWGYVDMHTHPMSHLAFAYKNFHGAPDVGSLIPAGTFYADAGFNVGEDKPDCNKEPFRARSVADALGVCNATHGGWGTDNNCGDYIRNGFISVMESMMDDAQSRHGKDVYGYNPNPALAFTSWPKWNDMTHQKMWVDWIKMAYQSGLRIMVALAHNNKVMGEIIAYNDKGTPKDDSTSADLQIKEIIDFVGRHADFMEIAYSSDDLYRIVKSNRMAVIAGIEVDYLGNLAITTEDNAASRSKVAMEIDRLYRNGVRYIFPIHLSDNAFGGTAIYENLMNIMQKLGTNTFWKIECSKPEDSINHRYEPEMDSRIRDALRAGLPLAPALLETINALLPLPPGIKEAAQPIISAIIASATASANILSPALSVMPDNPPACSSPAIGHRNQKGLTTLGIYAVKKMMQKGMLIDIDHMSGYAADTTLGLAKMFNYPVNSGHTGVRPASENQRTYRQLATISDLGGMFGVGWSGQQAKGWVENYDKGLVGMRNKGVCFGSDANSVVFTPKPNPGSRVAYNDFGFTAPQSFGHTWNYNTDGMAHYGMLRDFIRDIRNMGKNNELKVLFSSAQQFFLMWQKCESSKRNVRL